jgi:hypothetical protein
MFIYYSLEIREHGLLYQGSFLDWSEIQRYEWVPPKPTSMVALAKLPVRCLRLHRHRFFAIIPPDVIAVRKDLAAQVEEIFTRQFSAWPE